MSETTETRLRGILRELLGKDDLGDLGSINLRDDLGADSIDLIGLTMEIEEEFAIEITDDEAARAMGEHGDQPLSELVNLVDRKLAEVRA